METLRHKRCGVNSYDNDTNSKSEYHWYYGVGMLYATAVLIGSKTNVR
jgi:hypothetical protein